MKSVFFNIDAIQAEKIIMEDTGIHSIDLMEGAGKNSAETILKDHSDLLKNEVVMLCGKGNNAGDGFVIARHLAEKGFSVRIFLMYPETELRGDAKINYDILKNSGYRNVSTEKNYAELLNGDYEINGKLVIDAIFGIGFKGKPDEFISGVISKINSVQNNFVIAVDTPSCLDRFDTSNKLITADETLSMGSYKFETLFQHGKLASGKIKLIDIGVNDDLFEKNNCKKIFSTDDEFVKTIIPKRNVLSNKYQTGKVLVIAGSKGYSGAAVLSANAAMRMGSGAVVSAFPSEIESAMQSNLIEQVKLSLDYNNGRVFDEISGRLNWADAVLLGPGIGISPISHKLVNFVLKNSKCPLVIDGDAFNYITYDLLQNCNAGIVLTPHTGEFSRLLNVPLEKLNEDFYELSVNYAKENKATLVLKNAPSLITDGDRTFVNPIGRENLATFGSGDVLSGMIVSILSQTGNTLESAVAGCFIHGLCGDELYERTGPSSTIASDLISILPEIKNRFGI